MRSEPLYNDYELNVLSMRERLRVGDNFDMIERHLTVCERDVCLFYLDGFVKDAEMLRIMQYLLSQKSLGTAEELEAFENYIPEFFEDGAPLSIMLSGTFCYHKSDEVWSFNSYRPCPAKWEDKVLSCLSIKNTFYVGAEGMVAPCMGMCDCGYAKNFPCLYTTPLREILGDSHFMDLCSTTVKQVRDGNDKCRKCQYIDRCTGGCRNSALIESDNFYDVDKAVCFFFQSGWEERLRAVADQHYRAYCDKNGITPKEQDSIAPESDEFC